MQQKIVMLKGLPASGKSTYAKEMARKGFKVVNKDSLRLMLDNGQWSKPNEAFVLKIRDEIIIKAIVDGYSIIVDDTNLAKKHELHLRQLSESFGVLFEVNDSFLNVSIEDCISRDKARPNPVGKKFIMEMANLIDDEANLEPIVINNELEEAVIFDIDGTLALKCDRDIYDASKAIDDLINPMVYSLYCSFRNNGDKIIICTGRKKVHEQVTKDWLAKWNIEYNEFYIRKDGDSRRDSVVKREYLQDIVKKYNPKLSVDDRDQVVKMWRDNGVECWQVANGNF